MKFEDLASINLTKSPCLNSPYGEYERGLISILTYGTPHEDRTGVGTISQFGHQMRYSLAPTPIEGSDPFSEVLPRYPLVTTKKVHMKSVVHELIWMLKGDTNIKYLNDNGVTIWDEWAEERDVIHNEPEWDLSTRVHYATSHKILSYGRYLSCFGPTASIPSDQQKGHEFLDQLEIPRGGSWVLKTKGDLGPVYGKQWRDFNGFDQIKWVVDEIRKNPNSRRLLVSAWNPPRISEMKLPPCHVQFQFYVRNGKLSCKMDMRSCDAFLGNPFNLAQYALLTCMVAHCTNLVPHELFITFGDFHIYKNHIPQVLEQLSREPRPYPHLRIKGNHAYPWEIGYDDIEVVNYNPHPAIKADVAV